MWTGIHGQSLLEDGDQHINRHDNPDLSFHGILGISVEGLDSQVLFDPFEEQFNLPA